jgi:pentapeptide MXKDX repeat protein
LNPYSGTLPLAPPYSSSIKAFQAADHGDLFAIQPPLVTNASRSAKVKWRACRWQTKQKVLNMTKTMRALLSISALVLSAAVTMAPAAYAQDKMSKDGMTKDTMSKDGIKKDDPMSKDGMKNHDTMSKDGMAKDGMAKDGMKK